MREARTPQDRVSQNIPEREVFELKSVTWRIDTVEENDRIREPRSD